jgi:predicted acylesterase/phospholipase RssA
VRRLAGCEQIEDLRLPYFCISANLNRAELKMHTEGSLATALLASTRTPGIFPPVVIEGELHVDGGVLNKVPADLMKNFCNGGLVVGVDVSASHDRSTARDFGVGVSRWEALKRAFSPAGRRTKIRGTRLVMMRTLEVGGISCNGALAGAADLSLKPSVQEFGRTDFVRAAEIAEAGFCHARDRIRDWLNAPGAGCARRPDLSIYDYARSDEVHPDALSG